MKKALGGFAGSVLRDALRTPPRFSRSGPGRKAPWVQSNAGLFAEAGGKRPSGKARESAWNRASRGSARWAGSNLRRRHSCRRRIELRDERCPGRSGRGEAPPRATADGERRRRRPRSPQERRSLTREHPGFDSRRTVRREAATYPEDGARAKARAKSSQDRTRRCRGVRRRRAIPSVTGFVPSEVVLAGRVGCRDRRAACGRRRPGATSSRKRIGLGGPQRAFERAPKTGPGRQSPGIGSRSPVTSGVSSDRGGSRRRKASWFVEARGS